MKQLRSDKECMILIADKGVAMVVMKKGLPKKMKHPLEHKETQRPNPSDPNNKQKAKLITLLKKIKVENDIKEGT